MRSRLCKHLFCAHTRIQGQSGPGPATERCDVETIDRNLNAVEIGWPCRLGLQGLHSRSQSDVCWERTFGRGRKIVPEMVRCRCNEISVTSQPHCLRKTVTRQGRCLT